MRPEFKRSWARVVRAAVLIALVTPTAGRAAEEKLDVYVNPLEFERRIPPLAIGDPAPKLAASEVAPEPSEVALDPATLADYIGKYRFAFGVLDVTMNLTAWRAYGSMDGGETISE